MKSVPIGGCNCEYCNRVRESTLKAPVTTITVDWTPKLEPLTLIQSIAKDIANLVESKYAAYGDSIASVEVMLKELYPNGIAVDQYSTAFLLIRILDKIKRLAVGKSDNFENWQDIAGYALRALEKVKK